MASTHKEGRFPYKALEKPNTFRLLRVEGSQGSDIHCSLRHYILGSQDCPAYRAVSYTWGQDAPKHEIHMRDGHIFKVRRNLKNLLRHVRDKDAGSSGCWLWIDAICIDQNEDKERNHQVRLMAKIYGNANSVLVWLQSKSERIDVASAFRFIDAAATFDESDHSVSNYSRAHPEKLESSWHSMQKLCNLRYWTRKWIIQELILAQRVVLQTGTAECTMANFERFCNQLQNRRNRYAHEKLVKVENRVLESSAVTLAMQRFERGAVRQPRLLYDLVERYAKNDCHQPCDHIYALHSLVGQHNKHLDIDYSASPVERLVTVLRFVRSYENLPPSRTLDFVNLLIRLLRIEPGHLQSDINLVNSVQLTLPATLLGTVDMPDASTLSQAIRQMVEPLDPMPTFALDISSRTWELALHGMPKDPNERVGRPDMTYFRISNSIFHGLAACRLEEDDTIWHLPGTQMVFVMRQNSARRALLFGRAYLFLNESTEFWLRRPLDYGAVRKEERHMSMNLSTLLTLSDLAMPLNGGSSPDLNDFEETRRVKEEIANVWKDNRHEKVHVAGSSESSAYACPPSLAGSADKYQSSSSS
ncbi:hypothetical protein PRZ48_006316 [Zasmidium cellare]|uniref:Heterokaryon incompatibility domain-containing protein n=1 Tax=Zasmidium cellare TaxID=395010 RepID=A0ABR0ENZ9_ZASCE|nr:hypothetical protein PRZ48_006316 [Zasmidium cellare]